MSEFPPPPVGKPKNPYEILNLKIGATEDEIRAAWRNLAKKHHPDQQDGSHDSMQELNEAYAQLMDSEVRKELDSRLAVEEDLAGEADAILRGTSSGRSRKNAKAPRERDAAGTDAESITIEDRRTYSVGKALGMEYLVDAHTKQKLSKEGYTQIVDRGRFLVGVAPSKRIPTEYLLDPETGVRLAGPFSKIERNQNGQVMGTSRTGETVVEVPEWKKLSEDQAES